jgi:hypothetical protein
MATIRPKLVCLWVAIVGLAVAGFVFMPRSTAQSRAKANGDGALLVEDADGNLVRRQFAFSAQQLSDGTARGNAILHNPAFENESGQRYQLQIDIRCMKVIGNVAFFGGLTRRTNDPSLVDAVYFSVQDNGEPGKDSDQISLAFFFDDDPNTQGDPALCQGNQLGDFPMEPIESGNIQLRP